MSRSKPRRWELDWFQGLLLRGGVPFEDLPDDGRRLHPGETQALLGQLLSAEVGLKDFGPWRMGAHLVWKVVQGGVAVSRRELHARMRRFQPLLVLRPDGRLALRSAIVPAGQLVTAVGAAPGAVYGLHMAMKGAEGAGRPLPPG